MPKFTENELSCLSNESFEKLLKVVATYKIRIDSQCEINEAHDEIHD